MKGVRFLPSLLKLLYLKKKKKSIWQDRAATEAWSKALIALSVRAWRNLELRRLMLDRIIRKLSLEVTALVFPKEMRLCQICAVQI